MTASICTAPIGLTLPSLLASFKMWIRGLVADEEVEEEEEDEDVPLLTTTRFDTFSSPLDPVRRRFTAPPTEKVALPFCLPL